MAESASALPGQFARRAAVDGTELWILSSFLVFLCINSQPQSLLVNYLATLHSFRN